MNPIIKGRPSVPCTMSEDDDSEIGEGGGIEFIRVEDEHGASYEGQWKNTNQEPLSPEEALKSLLDPLEEGGAHGHGIRVWADGHRYEGQWKNGTMCGHGTMHYPGGVSYEGQWENDLMHGHGVVHTTTNNICEGHYREGIPFGHHFIKGPSGEAILLFEDGELVSEESPEAMLIEDLTIELLKLREEVRNLRRREDLD